MAAVLQSEVRLHEGILASLSLQAAVWDQHVQERVEVATLLEDAIANIKAAVRADEMNGQIQDRRLYLLFNLEELIQGLKISFDALLAYKQQLKKPDEAYSAFLDRHAAAFAEGIDWMEDLAESWSLSLDEARMSDIKARMVDLPRAPSEIRDWRAVLDELTHDAEVHD
jgi:hypothetical protein